MGGWYPFRCVNCEFVEGRYRNSKKCTKCGGRIERSSIIGEVIMSEHTEQALVIQWARLVGLEWLFAIPNGAKLPYTRGANGKRHCRQASILLAEGLTPGVSDLLLPVARSGYHGLFIEMKDGKNKTTPEQERFINFVQDAGYQAVKAIKEYLGAEAVTWPNL